MRPRSRGDWYEVVLGAALAAMVLYALGNSGVPRLLTDAEERGHSAVWVAVALLGFVLSAWTAGWSFAGPVAVTAARLHWLAWREPDVAIRAARRRALLVSAVAGAVVAVTAGLALSAAELPSVVPAVAVWTVLQLLLLAAVQLQRRDLDRTARLLPVAFGAAAVVVAAAEAWGAVAATVTACGAAAAGAAAVATGGGTARRRDTVAELTPRWQLHRAARRRWAVVAGITLMDGDVIRIVRNRDAKASKRALPVAVFRGPRPVGLAVTAFLRGLPAGLTIGAVAVVVAFAAHEILGLVPALVVIVLAELVVTRVTARAAEAWLASPALPRVWGVSGAGPAAALAAPAVVVCAVIAATVTAGLSLPAQAGLVLAALPVAVVLRRRTARRPDTGLTVIATPMGAVSVQAVDRVIAGPDVAFVALLAVHWLSS
ncbi:hypothetical protein [Jiangella sp. DSM 45060]|uniref:hypothetical protein n=1 Tax=Jiangella sp. DSM 45060 TaxID=1798224 RepID=UPI00087A7EBD|nr:hypothetical protein [Jiangella sp. DSM 45060]SDT57507.1 hypothetical protein SAMN04515669_4862 [Jiangella sp. DSM 45060]